MKIRSAVTAFAVAAAALLLPAFSSTAQAATLPPPPPVHVVAAGDIACATVTPTTCQQAATARRVISLKPQYVLALGDLAYPTEGSLYLKTLYDPAWGKFKAITKPVPGNHASPTLNGYWTYWAGKANPLLPSCRLNCQGYYSFNTGSWHIVGLNTATCLSETTGICGDFTAQAAWLAADLKAHPNKCTLIFQHNPLWSVGTSATKGVLPLYRAAIAGGADLIVTGHSHTYERFVPLNALGRPDPLHGITEIVAGTGGFNLQSIKAAPGVEVPNRIYAAAKFGVLDLQLGQGGWTSGFRPVGGGTLDPAAGKCH